MSVLGEALEVVRQEAAIFRAFPKLKLSVIGIAVIPALYAFIYLESVWDPASRTAELPAAIVNLDRGTLINGQVVNVGADLVRTLKDKKAFGFHDVDSADAAKDEVRRGRTLFALIIPPDFSADAMSAQRAGAAKLVMFASEGNNYTGAGFAKRFASELGHQLNETLSEKRWTAVLGSAASASDGLQRLREGVGRLREGAIALDGAVARARTGASQVADGAGKYSGGVAALADGVKQLAAGARTLESKKPAGSDLQAIKEGATRFAAGHAELGGAMPRLEEGARRLHAGATDLRDQAEPIPIFGSRVSAGADQLATGIAQLQAGLRSAAEGEAQLAAGAQALAGGVHQLADGFAAYGQGAAALASKFPPDAKLDELAQGGQQLTDATRKLDGGLLQLKSGTAQLAAGLDTLALSLPAGAPNVSGTPQGLAVSVQPQLEIDAPVRNNGMGFAPNFIPVALWLGATMTAFIFHLRRLPLSAQGSSAVALVLGKMGVLASVNVVQAGCVLTMVWLLLGLQPVHAAGLALTMVVSSITFMLLILLLVRMFGDVGKAIALILLILQLSSAGGVLPIELTNDFFRAVSPWLPFTWTVKAVRASAFGAFGGEWGSAIGVLLLFAAVAFCLALVAGRWRFVPEEEMRPAMDI